MGQAEDGPFSSLSFTASYFTPAAAVRVESIPCEMRGLVGARRSLAYGRLAAPVAFAEEAVPPPLPP